MACREDEAQEIVADVIVDRLFEMRDRVVSPRDGLDLEEQLPVPSVFHPVPAQGVDRTILRGGHEPGARVLRDARLGPLFERGDERVLCELLGEPDVAHDPRDAGDEPRRLDPKDGADRAVGIGGLHGPRSQHVLRSAQDRRAGGRAYLGGGGASPASKTWSTSASPSPAIFMKR